MRIFSVTGSGELVPRKALDKLKVHAAEGDMIDIDIYAGYDMRIDPGPDGVNITIVIPGGADEEPMHMDEEDLAILVEEAVAIVRAASPGSDVKVGDIRVTSQASNFPVMEDKVLEEEEEPELPDSLMRALEESAEDFGETAEAPQMTGPATAPGEYGPGIQAPPEQAPVAPAPQQPAPQAPQRQRQSQQ